MRFVVELDREEDGRWIADVPQLPGVMAYGETRQAVMSTVEALALNVLADRIRAGTFKLEDDAVTFEPLAVAS